MVKVDELGNRLDGDTICLVEWLIEDSLVTVPPLKFAWIGACNVNHVKLSGLIKSTVENRFTIYGYGWLAWFEYSGIGPVE